MFKLHGTFVMLLDALVYPTSDGARRKGKLLAWLMMGSRPQRAGTGRAPTLSAVKRGHDRGCGITTNGTAAYHVFHLTFPSHR